MKFVNKNAGKRLFAALALVGVSSMAMAADTIRIASVDAMSGPVGNLGTDTYNAEQIAVDEINAAGGIKSMGGALLELVPYDTESKVQTGQLQTERAISEGAVMILGTAQSSVTMGTTTVAERAKIPHIVTGSAADSITDRGYKFTFRILVTSTLVASTYVQKLEEIFAQYGRKPESVVVVFEDSAYGQSNSKRYTKAFGDAGIKYQELSFKTGSTDLSGLASRLRRVDADAMIYAGYVKDVVTLVEALREADVNFDYVNTSVGTTDPAFMKAIGADDAEGYIGIQYFNPNVSAPGNPDGPQKFYDSYRERFGRDPGLTSAMGYTAVRIAYKALEATGSTDPEALRAVLADLELRPEDGHILPYESVKFDETGQNVNANSPWAQIINGRLEIVAPAENATAKPLLPMPTWAEKEAKR